MELLFGLDYPTWWFLVIGGLFSGYAILDGFDFGAGAWHLFLNKEESRRIALNAIGPIWDGNEVWLVIGGGAIFAGFPVLYAVLFSTMYIPFMLFLFFIILRGISIEFRGKEEMLWWKKMWDVSYSISSIMLGFLLGVVLGNILTGFPIDANQEVEPQDFMSFINPLSVLTGFTSLTLFMAHGAIFLLLKTEGRLYAKLSILLKNGLIAFVLFFTVSTIYVLLYVPSLSDALKSQQWLFVIPILLILAVANIPRLARKQKFAQAFFFSSFTIATLLVLVAVELFPVLIPSTITKENDLTIYNTASSITTLKYLMKIVAIGAPLVISYTIIAYRVFWGKVKIDEHSY